MLLYVTRACSYHIYFFNELRTQNTLKSQLKINSPHQFPNYNIFSELFSHRTILLQYYKTKFKFEHARKRRIESTHPSQRDAVLYSLFKMQIGAKFDTAIIVTGTKESHPRKGLARNNIYDRILEWLDSKRVSGKRDAGRISFKFVILVSMILFVFRG